MCSLCARELSNRRKDSEGGGLTDNSPSFSFSLLQPAFDLVVYPPLCRLQCEKKERSCFWCHTQSSWLLFVNATMIFPQFLSHCLLSLIRLCPLPEVHFMLVRNFISQSSSARVTQLERPVCHFNSNSPHMTVQFRNQ